MCSVHGLRQCAGKALTIVNAVRTEITKFGVDITKVMASA